MDFQLIMQVSVAFIYVFSSNIYIGINLLHEEISTGLKNTKIIFLPANATSMCQPLDQGIIRTFKAYYKRKWLRYICSEYEKERNPVQSMNVLQAIRWTIEAWKEDVTDLTTNNCWVKSRVLSAKYGPITKLEAEGLGWKEKDETESIYDQIAKTMSDQIDDLVRCNRIARAMAIDQFLNPITEVVEDNDDDVVNVITDAYSTGERAYESDEDDVLEHKISANEAIQALHTLQLYEEQQNEGNRNFLTCIKKHEKLMYSRRVLKQTSITSYFT